MGGLSEAEREALFTALADWTSDLVWLEATTPHLSAAVERIVDAQVSAALAGVEALADEWETKVDNAGDTEMWPWNRKRARRWICASRQAHAWQLRAAIAAARSEQ